MSTNFSPQLIERAQQVFSQRAGKAISAEEVDILLDRLARLGLLALKGGDEYEQRRNSKRK